MILDPGAAVRRGASIKHLSTTTPAERDDTMITREKIMAKIRALMNKTTENGCTEAEALAALNMARAMMDAYEVTAEDIELKGETAEVFNNPSRDPNKTRSNLAVAIARFCDCKVWRAPDGIKFCGLRSDAEFATWLLETLAAFVDRELVKHLMTCGADRGERRKQIAGFTIGCCNRINERLNALSAQSAARASSNGRALVVAKGALIAAKMKELGLHLGRGRQTRRKIDRSSYSAGRAAGDRASFGRPVTGSGKTLALT